MTLHENSNRLSFSAKYVFLLIALLLTLTTFSQDLSKSVEWWTAITKKHEIKYNSFTLHGDCFIIGEKRVEGELEIFKDVIIISNGPGHYWIYKSESASYNSTNTTLKINDCSMERFKKDSKSLDPEKSYKHYDYSINLKNNYATMEVVK